MKTRPALVKRRWWSLMLLLSFVLAGSIRAATAQDADNTAYLPVVAGSTINEQQAGDATPAGDTITQPDNATLTTLSSDITVQPDVTSTTTEALTPTAPDWNHIGNFTLSGNLGVGLENPSEAISINAGPARFRINDFRNFPDGDPAFTFSTRGTPVGALFFQDALNNQMVLRAGPNSAGGTNNIIMQQTETNGTIVPLFISSNGRIGIGTITPSQRFHVLAPDAVGLFQSTTNQAYLRLSTSEGLDNRVELANRPGGRLALWTAGGGDVLNITRAGIVSINHNVGIGTQSPTDLLSVNGTASKPGGGSWAAFSDERIKKNVTAFSDGIDVLMGINPVRFQYNGLGGYEDDGKEYVGVLAQEVEQVAPYMVSTFATTDFADQRVYDSSALTYILVNAVQEQQKQIQTQQTQIEALQGENTELRSKLTELEQLHNEVAELKALVEQLAHQ